MAVFTYREGKSEREAARMIIRQKYLDRLIAYQDTDLVKVVTGIRR